MAANPQALPQDADTAEYFAHLAAQLRGATAGQFLDAALHGLSPQEVALIPEASVRAEAGARERDRAARTTAARKIIARAMFDSQLEWEELIESAWAGEMAAKLYATWAPVNLLEPVTEGDYAELLPQDIQAALTAREDPPKFAMVCENIGRAVVASAMRHIFDCHGMLDADLAREDAGEMDAECRRGLARGQE